MLESIGAENGQTENGLQRLLSVLKSGCKQSNYSAVSGVFLSY